jgi:WD40 repeat protein
MIGFRCFFLIVLAGFYVPSLLSQDSLSVTRPILHMDVKNDGNKSNFFLMLTYPDGRKLDSIQETYSPAWSPDGSVFAYITAKGENLRVRDFAGKEKDLLNVGGHQELVPRIAWSPDGKSIALLSLTTGERGPDRCALVVVDVTRAISRSVCLIPEGVVHIPGYTSPFNNLRWSRDGLKILISWESAAVIDVATGRLDTISSQPVIAEWGTTSKAVYFLPLEHYNEREMTFGGFSLYNVESKAISVVNDARLVASYGLRPKGITLGNLSMSPSYSKFMIVGGSWPVGRPDTIRLYSVADKEPLRIDRPLKSFKSDEAIAEVDWSPDEKFLTALTLSKDGVSLKVLDLANGEWKTIGTIALKSTDIEIFIHKLLSWSR